MSSTVLITGAAGYIGSHFIEEIYESTPAFLYGAKLVWVDNLSSGHESALNTLKQLSNAKGFPEPEFFNVDLLDVTALQKVFEETRPEAVIHFAAKISVAESVERPDFYFENNVTGSKNLLDAMKGVNCTRIVFSSTAAVYGKVENPKKANRPLKEDTPLKPINPYGKTKLMMEEAINAAAKEWGLQAVIFRYFNAAGASTSGNFGELHEPETHLIPLLMRAALSEKALQVYGTHYDTRDGSCIRDYIHVKDLASAHLLGLEKLLETHLDEPLVFNLGTERGSSVLEVIEAAEVVTGLKIIQEQKPNRAGDSPVLIADSSLARTELGWKPKHSSMHEILKTVMLWEKKSRAHSH